MFTNLQNSVDQGRLRYGTLKNDAEKKDEAKNSKCPNCPDQMGDHGEDGQCDVCGKRCG